MLLRQLAARWRHRDPRVKSYVRAGLGLEHRAHRLYAFWSAHLSRSRAAQARWTRDCGSGVLTVLGAGPLFDFNADALSARFQRFRLVDANPLAASFWRGLDIPVEPVITDISNCLHGWADAVKRCGEPWNETLALIRGLALKPTPAYAPSTDALLSLNILSQLEVGWQELLEPVLQKRFGSRLVRAREQEWLKAIRPSSQALVERHLAALEASNARHVLLISDTEYVDYTGRTYARKRWEAPPVQWTESGWRGDPGIRYEVSMALEGVALNEETLARWMPSYELEWRDCWLWHIAPFGTEPRNHGQLHLVAAFALRARQ